MTQTEVETNMETHTIELIRPIEFGKNTIERLHLREMTARDMRSLHQNMTYGDLLDIGGKIANQPKSVIDKLSVKDTNALVEYVGKLLEGGD
jgi:hypothetical protein